MNVLTISKKIFQNDDLVIIPKMEYEEFSLWKQIQNTKIGEYQPTLAERKDLKQSRVDYKKGKFITLNEFRKRLANCISRKSK